MFSNQTTKLIIVCTDEAREYGDYLMQLIGLRDDKGDGAVGLRDGSVDAVLWSEKDYKGNQATLPASTHILFIGSDKLIEEKSKNMNVVFGQYGMYFKSLGCQAVMNVDKKMPSKNDYEKFIDMANTYHKSFDKVKLNILKTASPAVKTIGIFLPYVCPAAIYGLISGSKAAKKIHRQRYSFLVLYSYLELLSRFIEG